MAQEIGGYRIEGKLGSGAFGTTYKAAKGGKTYALKVLKPDAVRTDVDRKRFDRECRALQKLSSPHVVPYVDHGVIEEDSETTYFLVMGFFDGGDLDRAVKAKGFPLPEASIRSWALQTLEGLAAIHDAKLVHRDLKPSNILLDPTDQIRIVDFGLVKMLDYTTITHTGALVGTPLYMAPEIMKGAPAEHRSDLYSFGVLLYYLLTGKHPLTATNHLHLVRRVTQESPVPPRAVSPQISNSLENLILSLLAKEPYLRPFSAKEVAEVLRKTPFQAPTGSQIAPAPQASLDRRQCWIRLLHNEKSAVTRALDHCTVDAAVFQANYLPKYKGQLEALRDAGVPYLFDPSTNRLAYSKFTQTDGLRALPYVYDKMNRLTPKSLASLEKQKDYAKDVLDWQISNGCHWLVSPFHFSRDLSSEWIDLDLKLFAEARDYLKAKGRSERLFHGVCFNIEAFTDAESRAALVNTLSRSQADGYLFYVDPIEERTAVAGQLFSYLNILLDFKQLGRPVVASRIGNLGLGVVALGIDAFEVGIASLGAFSEKDLLEDRPVGYNMQKRYYVPQLMTSLGLDLAVQILGSPAFAKLACHCPFCEGRRDVSLGQGAKEHFLFQRAEEMKALNSLLESGRLDWFLTRTKAALGLMQSIRKQLGAKLPPFQHLQTWLDVFPEAGKRLSASTRTR
jgi:serine/threonine protein kinase